MYRMDRLFILVGVFFLYHVTVCQADGPKCYKCDHVADPKGCDHYEQCSIGESCYVQRYMGQQLNDFYKMGCMSNSVCSQQKFSLFGEFVGKRQTPRNTHAHAIGESRAKREEDLLLCLQCCQGDYCNLHSELCGTVATTNRRCFECNDVEDPTHCEHIVECEPYHSCLLHVYMNNNANSARYDMRCEKDRVCSVLKTVVANSNDHVNCLECCNDKHYCNFDLCSGVKPALNNVSGSIGGSGSQPFTVQIPGASTAQPYNSPLTLKCQTSTTARISWKGPSDPLPAGVRVDPVTNDLVIDHVTDKTIGNYTCLAVPINNLQNIKAATSVVSIQTGPPVITLVSSNQHPAEHANLTLTCKADGWPAKFQFEWQFNNSMLTNPPPRLQYLNVYHGEVLSIFDFDSKYHAGTYSCRAKNSMGMSQSKSISLP